MKLTLLNKRKRRQFLSSLAGGIVIPDILVEKEFRKENQTKTIQYIDLEKYHLQKKPSQDSIKGSMKETKMYFL